MKVLWITNVELPEIAKNFNREVFVGGWLHQTSLLLNNKEDIELHIASMSNDSYDEVNINGIYYSSFLDNEESCKNRINGLFNKYDFDIVHIWGSEYEHSLITAKICEERNLLDKTIISIQGLSYYCAKYHYNAYLPDNAFNKSTIIETLAGKTNNSRKEQMLNRGYKELECLKLIKNCIGRTDWDEACVKLINPDINYYYCNEILRKGFYENTWDIKKCERNTIFFSQANRPIKGFHIMLEALSIIKEFYPNIKVRVLGGKESNIEKVKGGSYRKYLLDLITKYKLEDNVEWLGYLNEEQMIEQYLKCNVFVCASSIENSSNSIAEAMLLSVPVVVSDVGGIKSMLKHEEEGIIYQADAPYMLAYNVMRVLKDDDLALKLSVNGHLRAKKDHDIDDNMNKLFNIYNYLGNYEKQ